MASLHSSRSLDALSIRRASAAVHLPSRGKHGAILHLKNRRYTTLTAEAAQLWEILTSIEPTTASVLINHVSADRLRVDVSALVSTWLRRGLVVPSSEEERSS